MQAPQPTQHFHAAVVSTGAVLGLEKAAPDGLDYRHRTAGYAEFYKYLLDKTRGRTLTQRQSLRNSLVRCTGHDQAQDMQLYLGQAGPTLSMALTGDGQLARSITHFTFLKLELNTTIQSEPASYRVCAPPVAVWPPASFRQNRD
jgi:hypothetical protein